jgi:hypothetical protein
VSSYFQRFPAVIADCQVAGIWKSERKKVKQLLQSMSENNISYAATLQPFKAEVRRAKRSKGWHFPNLCWDRIGIPSHWREPAVRTMPRTSGDAAGK